MSSSSSLSPSLPNETVTIPKKRGRKPKIGIVPPTTAESQVNTLVIDDNNATAVIAATAAPISSEPIETTKTKKAPIKKTTSDTTIKEKKTKTVKEPKAKEPKEKKVKPKQVEEEPEQCPCCIENYTPILRKKAVCKYCKADSCSKCIERYLLQGINDAHCMNCRVNYNDETLREICTMTYIQQVYFKHRQQVLLSREKANLPGLQEAALEERDKREREAKVAQMRIELSNMEDILSKKKDNYYDVYNDYYSKLSLKSDVSELKKKLTEVNLDIEKYTQEIENFKLKIYDTRYPPRIDATGNKLEADKEERKKFIRRCARENCQGYLSSAWKCGLCEYYTCNKCFVPKTKKHDDPHECKQEDVDTAELIKKDSKPCPNCGEFIMKSSGCFAKDTPILMWNGSTKMSQDIKIGDELVGDDGNKRTVLDLCNGVDTMYEVKQNTGMTYIVNSKHTLVLRYTGEKNIYWFNNINAYKINWFDRINLCRKSHTVRITDNKTKEEAYKEIQDFRDALQFSEDIEIVVDDYMKLHSSDKKFLLGFKSLGINWEKKDVLLDPYLMGVYLGDGINDGMSFAINADADPEILNYILKWAENNDSEVVHDDMYRFRIRRRGNKQNTQKAIGRGASSETCKGCKKKLCKLCDIPEISYDNKDYTMSKKNKIVECIEHYGLLRNKKFIPNDYLINDRDTRLKLLAGIIDTDGHLTKAQEGKRILISSSVKQFADQIVLLSRSLGFATTIRAVSKKGISFKKGGEKKDYDDHYQINISGNICEIPTLIERKKCVNSTQNRLYTSIQVSEIGLGEYFGWKLDCNSKFILSDTSCVKNCSQMWCISCKTPWDWNTGKIEHGGMIHNPHYYEWMRRNGNADAIRNPADVPCGGYPNAWELRRIPRTVNKDLSSKFYEFHRICQEIQDISQRTYRSHIDNTTTSTINVRFLLNDYDEEHWGQLLAKNERKRKRDREVQEIFGAFRMVAVELLNRIQNYVKPGALTPSNRPVTIAEMLPIESEPLLQQFSIEVDGLLTMINDALKQVSIGYHYVVPNIVKNGVYYNLIHKNFYEDVKDAKRQALEAKKKSDTPSKKTTKVENIAPIKVPEVEVPPDQYFPDDSDEEEVQLQAAISASLA
jgi:hypothetical protein